MTVSLLEHYAKSYLYELPELNVTWLMLGFLKTSIIFNSRTQSYCDLNAPDVSTNRRNKTYFEWPFTIGKATHLPCYFWIRAVRQLLKLEKMGYSKERNCIWILFNIENLFRICGGIGCLVAKCNWVVVYEIYQSPNHQGPVRPFSVPQLKGWCSFAQVRHFACTVQHTFCFFFFSSSFSFHGWGESVMMNVCSGLIQQLYSNQMKCS